MRRSAHLGFGVDGDEGELWRSRRYSVARRIAGLFASYAVQRPRLVTDWREGQDLDGAGNKLDDDLLWQAELWRRLVKRVGGLPPDVRHTETLERLRSGGDGLDLPPRLSLFGHTRLPVTEVDCSARSGSCATCTCGPQVSGSLWDDLAGRAASGPVPREEDRAGSSSGIRSSGRSDGTHASCSGRCRWSRQARPAEGPPRCRRR